MSNKKPNVVNATELMKAALPDRVMTQADADRMGAFVMATADALEAEKVARKKLSDAAPALARLLLAHEWVDVGGDDPIERCLSCGNSPPFEQPCVGFGHLDDCEWVSLMRAAGVRE